MGICISFVKSIKHLRLIELKKDTNFESMNTVVPSTSLNVISSPGPSVATREFHDDTTSAYWLPKDADEHDRLTGQHFAYKELLNGNISSSVKETLDFKRGVSVLDIGCGSGAWLADMSSDYPNCTYHGCDIIDTPEIIEKLSNVTYRRGNVVQGLPYKDNSFDFVYMRLFVFALRAEEWPTAINEVLRITKPGGMVQFVDGTPIPPQDTKSVCYRTVIAMNSFGTERGQLPNIAYELENLVLSTSTAKIVQSYHVSVDTNDGTLLAKKFIWVFTKAAGGMMKHIGSRVDVHTKEEMSVYLAKYNEDMYINGIRVLNISLSIQKI